MAVEVLVVAIELVQRVVLMFVQQCALNMPLKIPAFAIVEEAAEHSVERMPASPVGTEMLLLLKKISSAVHLASRNS